MMHARTGPSNQQWNSVGDYVASQTATATATEARILVGLVKNPDRLMLNRLEMPSSAMHT